MTSAGRARRQFRVSSVFALAAMAYAFVLAAGPLAHHDLACHVKSRTHCTSCVSGVSAPGVAGTGEVSVAGLSRADLVRVPASDPPRSAAPRACAGRSPPASCFADHV